MKRLILVTFVLLFCAANAVSGESVELTLNDAVGAALRKNLTIREQNILVERADAQVHANRGAFDPAVRLEYYRGYNREATFSPLMSPEEKTERYGLAVGGMATTGTEYELKYSSTRVEQSEDTLFLDVNPYYTSGLTFTLRQPLLKGLGPDVQTARTLSARKAYEAAKLEASWNAAEVVLQTTGAYWDLYYVRRNLEVAEHSLELARSVQEEVDQKIQAGALPQVEMFGAEAEVALREERLLAARKAVRDAEDALRAHMDYVDADELQIDILTVSEPPEVIEEPPFEEALQAALQNRWDYRRAQRELESRQIEKHFHENQKLPALDLVAGAGVSGLGADEAEARREAESGDYYSWNIGVELSMPLGNRTAQGNYLAAVREAETAQLRIEQIRKTIVLELRESLRAIALTREGIRATERTRVAMEKRLNAARERFRLGMTTSNDVLRFEEDYAQAASNEIRARTDYAKAWERYRKASGTTILNPF